MSPARACFIGCSVVLLSVLVGTVLLVRWWTAPIDIPRVPPPSPPANNVYPVYRTMAAQMELKMEQDQNLREMSEHAGRTREDDTPVPPDEIRTLVRKWQPIRQAFRRYMHHPCQLVTAYDPTETFPELKFFRAWARVEAADATLALQDGDYDRILNNYEAVLTVSEQIHRGGFLMHYLTSMAGIGIISEPVSQSLNRLSAKQCEQLIEITRRWERHRETAEKVLENEWAWHINTLHDLYANRMTLSELMGNAEPRRPLSARWTNLRAAAHELRDLYQIAHREIQKPLLQQQPVPEPKHPVNAVLFPILTHFARRDCATTARIRLIAISAAVRLHRLRHGKYPNSIDEAGVADLNHDPFTGGSFVYRTSPKGFLVYSVGKDGRDDGGKRAAYDDEPGDIGVIRYDARRTNVPQALIPPADPVWLK